MEFQPALQADANTRGEQLDRAGMALSLACGLHCLVTPLLAGLAVSLNVGWLFGESAEAWLIGSAVVLGLLSLSVGYGTRHRRKTCFGWFLAGVALLVLAKFGPLGESWEPWGVAAGALGIVVAHATNLRFCRRCTQCSSGAEQT